MRINVNRVVMVVQYHVNIIVNWVMLIFDLLCVCIEQRYAVQYTRIHSYALSFSSFRTWYLEPNE